MIESQPIEWHQLDLRYADLRIHTQTAIHRMTRSIQSHGLLTPIVVAPLCPPKDTVSWVVIDGYLRIAAAKALRQDDIKALISPHTVKEALIMLYQHGSSRAWEAYEEAQLAQTLITEYKLSQTEIAQLLGKCKSWVTYRLQLLQELPDFAERAIKQGALSTWTTQRVILPFARANSLDAEKLVTYLTTNTQSSRDVQAYYIHYMRSNRPIRKKMTEAPEQFFKARHFQLKSECLTPEQLPPEEAWESILALCLSKLNVLESLLPGVFYPNQSVDERARYREAFTHLTEQVHNLQTRIEGACHV